MSKKKKKIKQAHLLDEHLSNVSVVVESSQVKGGETILLFHIHQLSRPGEDFFCGSEGRDKNRTLY